VEYRAVLETAILADRELDHESCFRDWVPYVRRLRSTEVELLVDENWGIAFGSQDSVLYGENCEIKELKDFLVELFSSVEPSADAYCDGACTIESCLSVAHVDTPTITVNCNLQSIRVTFAHSAVAFQEFWRERIRKDADESKVFQRFVEPAFWDLEFGPSGRNQWDKTGYEFKSVRSTLVTHLSYLCDNARVDWATSGYSDKVFAATAKAKGVLLSRDESGSNPRDYKDDGGRKWNCRHHTKLNQDHAGKSAFYGGRIYFCVDHETSVFIGLVCDHD